MTVRITKENVGQQTIVRIDGRLRSEVVPELERECQSVAGPLVLDLSQLLAADRSGIEKIRELVSRGARLSGTSRYLQMLLVDQTSGIGR